MLRNKLLKPLLEQVQMRKWGSPVSFIFIRDDTSLLFLGHCLDLG